MMGYGEKGKVQLVIFDLDGTLIDAYQAVDESVNFVMKELGLPRVGKARIVRSVGWGERHLLEQFMPREKVDQAVKLYRRHHSQSLKEGSRLLPGAKRLLKYLRKKGFYLAVASNRATRFSHLVARYLGIQEYFDFILCRDRVKRPKPYPDLLLGILKKFSLSAVNAVYVGDMTVDIEAGKRAKMRTIAVVTGSSTLKEIKDCQPDRIVNNIYNVRRILEEMNKK